jgi:hypothetical protein
MHIDDRDVRFSDAERRHLLAQPGLGPVVVQRLESAGVGSLDALRQRGVDRVIDLLCRSGGSVAWRNRRRALARAVASY